MGAKQSDQNKTINYGIYIYYYGLLADQQIRMINSLSRLDIAIISWHITNIYGLLDNPITDVNYKSLDDLTCFTRYARHIYPFCERHDILDKFLMRGGDLTQFLMFQNTVSVVSERVFTHGSLFVITNILENSYYCEMTTFDNIKIAITRLLKRNDYDENNSSKFRAFCVLFMLLRQKTRSHEQLISACIFDIALNTKKYRVMDHIIKSVELHQE
jgi:hypothetical protein